MTEGVKPPRWFWIVSGILVLWGLMGCWAVYAHVAWGPKIDPAATQWDYDYYAALPGWFVWDFVVAVGGGLLGSIAMLARSRFAQPLYIASLIGVVIQFGYVFLATDLLAHKGWLATLFPALIFAIAVFQIWFARRAAASGWIS